VNDLFANVTIAILLESDTCCPASTPPAATYCPEGTTSLTVVYEVVVGPITAVDLYKANLIVFPPHAKLCVPVKISLLNEYATPCVIAILFSF